jgi:hypothetical protein
MSDIGEVIKKIVDSQAFPIIKLQKKAPRQRGDARVFPNNGTTNDI